MFICEFQGFLLCAFWAHSAWIYVPFSNLMCLLYELFPYYQLWMFSDVILNTSFKNDMLERNGISCLWLSKITRRPGVVVVHNRKLFDFQCFLLFSWNKFCIKGYDSIMNFCYFCEFHVILSILQIPLYFRKHRIFQAQHCRWIQNQGQGGNFWGTFYHFQEHAS